MLIEKNIISINLKNIVQSAQLKKDNMQIIKNYHLYIFQIISLKL